MIVNEAIALLITSELKNLKVGEDPATVLGYINMGILEIHKRFMLWEAEAVITQAADVYTYSLNGTDGNVSIDLSDNDLIKVERVTDEDDLPYVINNEKEESSIHTPRYNQIKLNTLEEDLPYEMTVKYRASPKFLTAGTDEIPLPPQYIEALFLYVGYKGQLSIKSGLKEENNTHFIRFEASCNRIVYEGIDMDNDLESNKFEQRGFV